MERLNLHIDEAGNQDLSEGLYLVAVVLHDHKDNVVEPIQSYEGRLRYAGLQDIPFHSMARTYFMVTEHTKRRLPAFENVCSHSSHD